jgi:signal transduction histidine kinase
LYLAIVPAIVGIFAVAGLAYWGQYGRQAPELLVIIAVVASVASLIVAWRNTRYVATRIARLAAPAMVTRVDELDAIEEEVGRLQRAVTDAKATEALAKQYSEAAIHEYGGLVADTATSVAHQLDEVRMPLHILLDNHFGDLNENQEEMLAAARSAADDAQGSLDRLREIADLDRRAIRLRTERIRLSDLVNALMPGLAAEGTRAGVRVSADLPPFLPPVAGDRVRLGEALSLLATDGVRRTPSGGEVQITGVAVEPPLPRALKGGSGTGPADVGRSGQRRDPREVQLVITHGSGPARQTDVSLADRLLVALGGRVDYAVDRTVITLPAYAVAATVGSGTEPANPSQTS